MRSLLVGTLLLIGCTPSGGRTGAASNHVHQGPGYALRVPDGSRVRATPALLQVDAPDGRWWFDLTWSEHPAQRAIADWAAEHCGAIQWDRAAAPTPRTTTVSGLCNWNGVPMWLLAAAETHDGATLLTAFIGDKRFLPLEDAWTLFVHAPLSLAGGGSPVDVPPEAEIRARLRELAASGAIGSRPVPGGGELSPRMMESLAPVWQARLASPPPRSLGEPPAPSVVGQPPDR